MKRILFAILLCVALGGCSGKGYEDMREIESFEIIRTLGVDYEDGMYTLTAASGSAGGGEVAVLTSRSVTIARALQKMQNYSTKKYIFFGHTANYLVGEAAAEHDLSACLEYVERGFDMRLDTNLFIVRGGTAKDAIAGASEKGEGVTEHLLALEKDVQILSENHIVDCGEAAEELAADGCTAITAVSLWENENVPLGEGKKGVQVVGSAIIKDGRLVGWADVDTARGITLLTNRFVSDAAELPDGRGSYMAVEMSEGETEYFARFSGDRIEKIIIRIKLQGNISEMESPADIYDERVISEIERVLAENEVERIVNVIELSRRLDADFLELKRELELKYPRQLRQVAGTDVEDCEMEINVEVEVKGSYELGVSPAERRTREHDR
ncbi:MAG: hypothetical protein IKT47_00875 [Oscillospiraceae bacterium]|nr:hypothetical protein [Oscillospiraceae bacterium]